LFLNGLFNRNWPSRKTSPGCRLETLTICKRSIGVCGVSKQDAWLGGSADVWRRWPSTMGCLSSTLGGTGKMVPEVPATSVVQTVYTTDKNGINAAVIVNGHRTSGHEQLVSPDKITVEEDPTAGALTTKKVNCCFLMSERTIIL